MAAITIDGVELIVSDNKNVLECALQAGIYIPHLCHHPDLPDIGACRLCVVEADGQEAPAAACELMPRDGMRIQTKSKKIEALRMLSLELLLTCHPEDCSTCLKYGNCELQTLIQYIGPKTGRLKARVKGFPSNEDNPLLVHEQNRCVLCGRCVRVCRELRGANVLDYRKKDGEVYAGTETGGTLAENNCRFCGACAEVCPTGAIRDKINLDKATPCRSGCPAGIDIPRYVRYTKQGEYDKAAAVVREKAPLPGVLGHICNHACEEKCKRGDLNAPLSIRNIKRYAIEQDTGAYWRGKGKQLSESGKKVCVIGAGPAGLSAAYYLRKQGHQVLIKEAMPKPGGMMAYGIPEYRLPEPVLNREIELIMQTGVTIETSCRIESFAEIQKEFDAVLVAVGCHKGTRPSIEGCNLPGVITNIDFLKAVRKGGAETDERVVVLGGGNVAFDCARSAVRLGAKQVSVVCLESRGTMTADAEEIIQAEEEGVTVYAGYSFEKITGADTVSGLDMMKIKSFSFDENHRAVIVKEEGTPQHLETGTVIFAVGQKPELDSNCGLPINPFGYIESVGGIFAAGDAVYGTKSVIQAIQSGREAASAIDLYLGGDGDITETFLPDEAPDAYIGESVGFAYLDRQMPDMLNAKDRICGFSTVDSGLNRCSVNKETERCLQCDLRLSIAKPKIWSDFANSKTEV